MLGDNKIKEEINLAYILAIAGSNGFITEFTRVDVDSIDVTIKISGKLSEDSILSSPEIKIQLKATSNADIKDNNIHFPLPKKNYDDLRARCANPRLLVVLCLPELKTDWLSHSSDELVLKKCAYYLSIKDYPDSSNETSVTVKIPLENVFSPTSLFEMMLKTSKQEDL
jgi:hypothetical protein